MKKMVIVFDILETEEGDGKIVHIKTTNPSATNSFVIVNGEAEKLMSTICDYLVEKNKVK